MGTCKRTLVTLWTFRKTILLIAFPLITSPLLFVVGDSAAKCGWVAIVMAGYWTCEVVPLAVTAFLPIILFPLLGVQNSKDVAQNYFKDTLFLVLGGLIMAIAVQHWNLHKRIALRVLLLVGTHPRWLMLGFMCITAFLSMWISNTATTAMMVPIVNSLLMQMFSDRNMEPSSEKHKYDSIFTTEGVDNLQITCTNANEDEARDSHPSTTADYQKMHIDEVDDQKLRETNLSNKEETLENCVEQVTSDSAPIVPSDGFDGTFYTSLSPGELSVCKGMMLSIAYAASYGGMGSLTGTAANAVMVGVVEDLYGEEPGITFASWFVFAVPGMVINLIVGWYWLQYMYLGKSLVSCFRGCKPSCNCSERNVRGDGQAIRSVIRKQYDELGSMSWAEAWVLVHFVALALLWMTRNLSFIPNATGWAGLFPESAFVADATAGMFVSFLLFIFPSKPPNFLCLNDGTTAEPRLPLVTWSLVQRNLPWHILMLVGGGFALADACRVSGLSEWLAEQFGILQHVPAPVTVIIITTTICLFTEVTSNVATATVFMPVLASLAESICVNPLYIMVPATFSCSFAFMLPVATPPNAIVFSYGTLTVPDMVKSGLVMNAYCLVLINVMINTLGIPLFDVHNYPAWAMVSNSTCQV